MNELQCDKLWTTIRRLAKKPGTKRAAVAYVTSDEHVKFGEGDVLVTDASDAAIKSGQTDAAVLAKASERGARLYSLQDLHGKVLVLNGTAVIGSTNLSTNSESMVEAAWVTDHPTAVSMATYLVEALAAEADPVNKPFLRRIQRIKVTRRGRGGRRRRRTEIKVPQPHTWIAAIHELVRDFPREEEAIAKGQEIAETKRMKESSGVEWIRFTGHSRFRSQAKRGDNVIQLWCGNAKSPQRVYRAAPILHRQDEATCTRFYLEESRDANKRALSLSQFRKVATRVGIPGRIGLGSVRLVDDKQATALFSSWGK